jgi:hypothetical protein
MLNLIYMTKEQKIEAPRSKFVLRRSDWAILPLGFLTLYSWYRVFADPIDFRLGLFGMWHHNILLHPSLAMLAIAVFGSLYIYRDLRRKDVGRYARGIAYLLACLVIFYILVQLLAAIPNGPTSLCSGFLGIRTRCAEVTQLQFYIYLQNPFSLFLWGVLSTIGSIVLLLKIRHEKLAN